MFAGGAMTGRHRRPGGSNDGGASFHRQGIVRCRFSKRHALFACSALALSSRLLRAWQMVERRSISMARLRGRLPSPVAALGPSFPPPPLAETAGILVLVPVPVLSSPSRAAESPIGAATSPLVFEERWAGKWGGSRDCPWLGKIVRAQRGGSYFPVSGRWTPRWVAARRGSVGFLAVIVAKTNRLQPSALVFRAEAGPMPRLGEFTRSQLRRARTHEIYEENMPCPGKH